jgi:predicted nucleotidyltransferase/DNA-binding XRE family transcriptional regulator
MSEDSPSAGALLRNARRQASLSQTDLARRAHIAQSVVSAYESGRREPAFSTLVRLVDATGHRLVVELEPDGRSRPGLPDTPLGRRLRRHRAAVLETVRRHGASNVRVFGSVARGEDGPESDVDLVVDLAPGTGLVGWATLERELSQVLGAPVDVAPSDSLRPELRDAVEAEAIPL